jgi:hypothetical protein
VITLIAYTGKGYPIEHNYDHEQLGELRMNIDNCAIPNNINLVVIFDPLLHDLAGSKLVATRLILFGMAQLSMY